jgi:hypothetical protein
MSFYNVAYLNTTGGLRGTLRDSGSLFKQTPAPSTQFKQPSLVITRHSPPIPSSYLAGFAWAKWSVFHGHEVKGFRGFNSNLSVSNQLSEAKSV